MSNGGWNKANLINRRFGRLKVIEYAGSVNEHTTWKCECDCGNEKVISENSLVNGNCKSCGCLQREMARAMMTKHGLRKHPLYRIWHHMKSRCCTKTDPKYPAYGARGITVCSEWKSDFLSFYQWSIANGYKENLSIDRINNNKGYSPDNCRWADNITQSNNRRNNHLLEMGGKTMTIAEWSRQTGINQKTIATRLSRGWSAERALTKA